MDYKEQMKRANENNAFMIHNGVRAVELVTIDSSFRFLRSAGPSEPLYAEARVTKRGRTVSFCHSGVYGRDSGKLFAEGDFTFFCQE